MKAHAFKFYRNGEIAMHCGLKASEASDGDFVALEPTAVTCPGCLVAIDRDQDRSSVTRLRCVSEN